MQLFSYLIDGEQRSGRLVGLLGVDVQRALSVYLEENPRPAELPSFEVARLTDLAALAPELLPLIEEATNWVLQLPPDAVALQNKKTILFEFNTVTLLPPISRPGKVICIGGNYPSAQDKNGPEFPTVFLKPASGVAADQMEVCLPTIAQNVACEVELAVVIGKTGHNLSLEETANVIIGYTLANDLGDHSIEKRTSQWTSGKMFDGFTPMGPVLFTPCELMQYDGLKLYTKVNGMTVQQGSTSQMFFDVAYLVSYLSTLTTLEPGDVILTGSPKTINGQPNPAYALKPGDTIEIGIEKLCSLWNTTIAERSN